MTSIVFMLLIGLVAFAYVLYQQKKRIVVLEESLNELNEVQEIKTIKANLEGRDLERMRIAKDWHDGIGNSLSTLRLILDTIQAQNPERHTEALILLEHTQREFRQIVDNELVNDFLDKDAVIKTLAKWKRQLQFGNIELQFNVYNLNLYNEASISLKSHLYRMTQELLTNSLKHAHASQIKIAFKEEQNVLSLIVEDNGTGFREIISENSFLRSIKYRLIILDGKIVVDAKENEGAKVVLFLPL